jgi:putative oxidoreductase
MTDTAPSPQGSSADLAEVLAAAPPAPVVARTPLSYCVARSTAFMSAALPYWLVAIVLRLVIACAVFQAGQAKIEGPMVPLQVWGFDFSVTLPMAVNAQTVETFDRLVQLAIPSWIVALAVGAAEFILPIFLVLGLATRFAAIVLLVVTVALQALLAPDLLWSQHAPWAALLLVLIALGPGPVSIDHAVSQLYRK